MIFRIKHFILKNKRQKLPIFIFFVLIISLHFIFLFEKSDLLMRNLNKFEKSESVKFSKIENVIPKNNTTNEPVKILEKENLNVPETNTVIESIKVPVTENNKNESIKDLNTKNNDIPKNNTIIENKYKIVESYSLMNKIKKEPYYDPFGIDLNEYIMDGMLNKAINNNTEDTIEDWDLYTPPCPNLHPVHYSEEVLNPVCEDIGIPFYKVTNNGNNFESIPAIMRLHDITDQMKKWEDWISRDKPFPNYRNASVDELLNDEYHPFDYGYYNYEKNEDEDYYEKVVNSSMDEVPDPRRRRLFSIILFNSEFELLDLYLSEYYEIVDYFIIYESNSTFSGYKKPLYLTRTLLETNRYKNYRDKIIPITLPVLDVKSYDQRGPGFPREHLARREVIEKGLRAVHARHGDMFIHGDLDEMPKARLLSYLKKCGGWEHLQMGIGGGPKPINDPKTKSYFKDKKIKVSKDKMGQFQIDYSLKPSLPFTVFFNEYSFHTIQNPLVSDFFHPNLAIFDARRALGQIPEVNNDGTKFDAKIIHKIQARDFKNDDYKNGITKRSKLIDTSKFDPYRGYSYSNNLNNKRKGEGYLGENAMRFMTNIKIDENGTLINGDIVGFWKSGWHLSSFFPNVKQFFNKVVSYSHFNFYNNLSDEEKMKEITFRVQNDYYIFGRKKNPMNTINVKIPVTDEEKYPNMFSYKLWNQIIQEYNKTGKSPSFELLNDFVLHEIPRQIMENPICYSYMLDRQFGFNKKLWWEIIPKKDWNKIDFKVLDDSLLDKISPKVNKKN